MLIKVKKSWELPESAATPEHVFFGSSRRRFLAGFVPRPGLSELRHLWELTFQERNIDGCWRSERTTSTRVPNGVTVERNGSGCA